MEKYEICIQINSRCSTTVNLQRSHLLLAKVFYLVGSWILLMTVNIEDMFIKCGRSRKSSVWKRENTRKYDSLKKHLFYHFKVKQRLTPLFMPLNDSENAKLHKTCEGNICSIAILDILLKTYRCFYSLIQKFYMQDIITHIHNKDF